MIVGKTVQNDMRTRGLVLRVGMNEHGRHVLLVELEGGRMEDWIAVQCKIVDTPEVKTETKVGDTVEFQRGPLGDRETGTVVEVIGFAIRVRSDTHWLGLPEVTKC